MNILEKITERTKERIEEEKKIVPLEEVRRQAEEKGIKDQIPAFEQALRAEGLSFICEAKKASPSKGLIAPDFPYVEIARDYEAGGAAAISCLTEPFWFRGSDGSLGSTSDLFGIRRWQVKSVSSAGRRTRIICFGRNT